MICIECNTNVIHCKCPDIEERLKAAAVGSIFAQDIEYILDYRDLLKPLEPMTFRQLKEELESIREEHLDMIASVVSHGEIMPIKECIFAGEYLHKELIGTVAEDQPLLVIA